MKENSDQDITGPQLLWTGNAAPIMQLFQNSDVSALKIMHIYDEPLLSGHATSIKKPLAGMLRVVA